MQKIGLLMMAYGTPYKREDIAPFYTAIRHGRRPSDGQIAELARRYETIGGLSPLAELTKRQASVLEQHLNAYQRDFVFKTYLGLKYIHPFIEDAVTAMHRDGVQKAIALALAPHYSLFSVRAYAKRALDAARKTGGPEIYPIKSWYRQPLFIRFWVKQIADELNGVPEAERDAAIVIFTAHSLPKRILENNDPYPEQIAETIRAIVAQTGDIHYAQSWQSAGKTGDPWLGPDIRDKIRELADSGRWKHFIICPIGFVAEHLEVLYDNDYECRRLIEKLGGHYHRPKMPDTDPRFIGALTDAVLSACREKKPIGRH
ncbi:MAG: ferrochelatase [Sporolactobacillus sp.]|jgi:ferrochelatase|nr:ferrochelatase [Sporolactobacillus sp.]MCI1882097.1 ferrochelatase [Sporolactobacillus sp.]